MKSLLTQSDHASLSIDSQLIYIHTHGTASFAASAIPSGFMAVAIQGFVDVLVVNDDPEYQVCLPRISLYFVNLKLS